MSRMVFCVNVADDIRPRVADNFCDPATRPAETQSCTGNCKFKYNLELSVYMHTMFIPTL